MTRAVLWSAVGASAVPVAYAVCWGAVVVGYFIADVITDRRYRRA